MPIPLPEVRQMHAMVLNQLHADPASTVALEKLQLLDEILWLHGEIAGTNPPDPIWVQDRSGDHVEPAADDVNVLQP